MLENKRRVLAVINYYLSESYYYGKGREKRESNDWCIISEKIIRHLSAVELKQFKLRDFLFSRLKGATTARHDTTETSEIRKALIKVKF